MAARAGNRPGQAEGGGELTEGRESAVTGIDLRDSAVVLSPGLETRRALEVSSLDRHILIHDTVAEALEAAR